MADISAHDSGGFQKLYDLFPDGPPTTEIAKLGVEIAIKEVQESLGVTTIDEPSIFRVEMPTGSVIEARKRSRQRWSIMLQSAKTFSGNQITLHRSARAYLEDDYEARVAALIDVGNLGRDMAMVRQIIIQTIAEDSKVPLGELAPNKVPVNRLIQLIHAGDNIEVNFVFDTFFNELNTNYKETGSWKGDSYLANVPFAFKLRSTGLHTPDDELLVLIAVALMEYYQEMHQTLFEEECELAKHNSEKVWWHITGGKQSIAKLTATLDKNSHFVVLNNPESIYMNIQNAEQKFVSGIVSKFNCKARQCDKPGWGTTACGKLHAHPDAHSARCNSCRRQKEQQVRNVMAPNNKDEGIESTTTQEPVGNFTPSNAKMREPGATLVPVPHTGSLKKQEEKEWQSRNGEVVTVQGPKQGLDPMDFQGLATEYRRVSDELLERANYFSTLAEKYEVLLKPSDAVRQAQEALDQAQAHEHSEREAQIQSLMTMITDGPPIV